MTLEANIPRPEVPAARARQLAEIVATEARRRLGTNIRVIWFGSWVQGTAQPHSDIDLAIDSPEPFTITAVAALRTWVDELPTLYSIDLVDLHEVSADFRRRIDAEGVEV